MRTTSLKISSTTEIDSMTSPATPGSASLLVGLGIQPKDSDEITNVTGELSPRAQSYLLNVNVNAMLQLRLLQQIRHCRPVR